MDFRNGEGLRQSDRIKESYPFINVYAIENEGSATRSPAVVYKFDREVVKSVNFNHEMEKGNLKYAPSLRNPYYMSIPANMLTLLTGATFGQPQWATESSIRRDLPSAEIIACFYVSLKLFYDMANDEVDWYSLSCLEDPQVVPTSDSVTIQEAETLKEIAFGSLADPPKKDPIDGLPYDPPIVKIEEPKTGAPPHHLPKQVSNPSSVINWYGVREEISVHTGPDVPRRLYIPIRHQRGWLIWIRKPDWKVDREARRAQLRGLKKVFEKLWMYNTATDPESATGYRPRYSSVDLHFSLYVVPQPKNLILRLGWQAGQINTKFGALVEKINIEKSQLNTTLIPTTEGEVNKEENKGKVVKMGENPFGLFTTYITADDYNTYMTGLETLTDTLLTLESHNAHRIATRSTDELMLWLVNHYKPLPDISYTPQQQALIKLIEASRGDSINAIPEEIPLYVEEAAHGSTWSIIVSQDKMRGAGGKRNTEYAPSKVMGMSANEAADEGFGWLKLDQAEQCLGHQHRLSNGMYMAEWLHLCAFSWGGLSTTAESTKLIYRTSDIPENLILGTSETNSLMTRFEKAWQTLVKDASDLTADEEGNSAFYAKLVVSRNRDTEPVTWDLRNNNTGVYYREELASMSTTEIQIATQFRFVGYTVSYSIEFPEGCEMLSMKSGESLKTTFYPFLRPLYHKLEDQLDQMLYQGIKTRYLGVDISNSMNVALNGINPTVTYGQILYDGTEGYGGEIDLGMEEHKTQDRPVAQKRGGFKPYNTKGETIHRAGIRPTGKAKKLARGPYGDL